MEMYKCRNDGNRAWFRMRDGYLCFECFKKEMENNETSGLSKMHGEAPFNWSSHSSLEVLRQEAIKQGRETVYLFKMPQ